MSRPDPDPDPRRESLERIVALGKGPKGDKGDEGERGLPRAQRLAIVSMFVMCMLFVGLCFLGLFHYARDLADQEHAVATQQKMLNQQQRELARATAANSRQRCASVVAESRIPLPHPIAGNPSRIWEAHFEALQAQRAHDLGCR